MSGLKIEVIDGKKYQPVIRKQFWCGELKAGGESFKVKCAFTSLPKCPECEASHRKDCSDVYFIDVK